MDTNRRFCGLLRSEQLSILSESGINIEDMSTWSDENRKDFMMKNPGYKIEIHKEYTLIHNVDLSVVSKPITLTVYEDDKFVKRDGKCFCDKWSDEIFLKNGIGDRVEVEAPFNARFFCETFKDSDAKTIVLKNGDFSNYEYVGNLFTGNEKIEEIDMRGCKYPYAEKPYYLPKADFSCMFEGCTNLKRLYLQVPSEYFIFSERGYELRKCFRGCKNIEYLYIEGDTKNKFINEVIEVSEKKVTLDGVFSYIESCPYTGGMLLDADRADLFEGKFRLSFYPENEKVNFVGKIIESSLDNYLEYVESVMDQGRLDEDDYYTAKYYLEKCRKEQVIV